VRFFYVYRLESQKNPKLHYTGFTEDLQQRLVDHNASKVPTTSGQGPWSLLSAHAFADKAKALAFEKYLKSGSGREFARRHF
jgi:predicted GIY-YIG superfamily endonuclease